MSAEKILIRLIKIFSLNLTELANATEKTEFIEGELTAYVDCLENIQLWEKAKSYGLNYNVAEKFL